MSLLKPTLYIPNKPNALLSRVKLMPSKISSASKHAPNCIALLFTMISVQRLKLAQLPKAKAECNKTAGSRIRVPKGTLWQTSRWSWVERGQRGAMEAMQCSEMPSSQYLTTGNFFLKTIIYFYCLCCYSFFCFFSISLPPPSSTTPATPPPPPAAPGQSPRFCPCAQAVHKCSLADPFAIFHLALNQSMGLFCWHKTILKIFLNMIYFKQLMIDHWAVFSFSVLPFPESLMCLTAFCPG